MKSLLIVLSFLVTFQFYSNNDWGKTGHRTVAEIANHYLSEKAKANINLLLHGQSLAVASTYADEIKSDEQYDEFKPWHYANVPFDKTYLEADKNEDGDIVIGIQYCINVLKDSTSDEEDKTFYLKMLIHLMGDLHQPLHFGLKEDLGANRFYVDWFGDNSNFHKVWDSEMIDSHGMSYTEMVKNKAVLSLEEIHKYAEGDLIDWVEDTRKLTKQVYNSAEHRENLGYRYMYDWYDTLNLQLHKAGIRLAKVLNNIFG
ncbi:S1/P1 nuclease [Psychroflexus sp. MBR-150]|jgi:hypothetical protein